MMRAVSIFSSPRRSYELLREKAQRCLSPGRISPIYLGCEQCQCSPRHSISLPWSKQPKAVRSCMTRESNAFIRRVAIRDFGRRLTCERRCMRDGESSWNPHGDSQVLIQLFSTSSGTDVNHLCISIGRYYRGRKSSDKQQGVEHLLKGLLHITRAYTSPPRGAQGTKRGRTSPSTLPLQHVVGLLL